MAYFDGIEVGDKIYTLLEGWTKIRYVNIGSKSFITVNNKYYNFDGKLIDGYGIILSDQQIAFWDEIKIEPPKKPKIKLKNDYRKIFNDMPGCEIPITSFNRLIRFSKLLALRDEFCPDSRGYEFLDGEKNWYIYGENDYYLFSAFSYYAPDKVYFRTKEDAQKICDILNDKRFEL